MLYFTLFAKQYLLKTADEIGDLVRMLTKVYWPYYKEKKEKYDYEYDVK